MEKKLTVIARVLNLRAEPNKNSIDIGDLLQNEVVSLLRMSKDCYWAFVRRENGEEGWVSMKYMLGVPEKKDIKQSDPEWLKIAFGEKGVFELKDPLENARIVQYLKSCDEAPAEVDMESDETPWCSAFVNWCIEKSNYVGTDSLWALKWNYWGYEVTPQRGAITVFKRFVSSGGKIETYGHVGFYLGEDKNNPDQIFVLGGNQADKVKVSTYPKKSSKYELLGFRGIAGWGL